MEQHTVVENGEMNTIEVENPLVSLTQKLEAQNKAKYDMVVPAGHIKYVAGEMQVENVDTLFRVSETVDDQISEKLEIPRAYYRKMKSTYPELLDTNVNSWLSKKTQTKYLLRTFQYPGAESICRAMLSNSYNIIDHYDVLIAALEAIDALGVHVEITKATVTEKRMYLHVTCPEIQIEADDLLKDYKGREELGRGNGIISGLVIANSEVGCGGFEVAARAVIVKCTNGLLDREGKFRKVHLGAKLDTGVIEWNQNVKQKNYQLVIEQTKQAVQTYLSKEYLGKQIAKLEAANGFEVEHPTAVIERVGMELNIPDTHRQAILNRFIRGGQTSGAGIFNAVTRQAQDVDSDTAFEWESGVFQMLPRLQSMDKPLSKN